MKEHKRGKAIANLMTISILKDNSSVPGDIAREDFPFRRGSHSFIESTDIKYLVRWDGNH